MTTTGSWFERSVSVRRHVSVGALAVAAYLATDVAAAVFEFWPGTASLFLPAGIAVALLVGLGPGHAVTVFAAMLIAAYWPDSSSYSLPVILGWAVSVTSLYTGTAWLLRERTRFDPGFHRFSDGVRFAGWYFLTSLIAATVVTVLRHLGSDTAWIELATVTTAFWIGDAAAILALGPFLLLWLLPVIRGDRNPPNVRGRAPAWEVALQFVAVVAVLTLVGFGRTRLAEPALFLLFVPLLWIVARSGLPIATAANVLLTMGAAALLGSDPGAAHPALLLSSVLVALSATTLLLGASLSERDRTFSSLEDRRRSLARAERVAQMGSWSWDVRADECTWTDQLYDIHGRSRAEPVEAGTYLEYVVPGERDEVRDAVEQAVARAGRFDIEYTLVTDDNRRRHIRSRGSCELDDEGQLSRVIGTCRDVTETRIAEEEALRSRRMEALGRLAAGVAHDFNNFLTVIQSRTALLQAGDDPEENLSEIQRAVEKARTLNRQLLDFARGGGSVELETVDLGKELAEHEWIFRRMVGGRATLALDLETDLPAVAIERSWFEQVVNNLIVNAREALNDDGGTIRLRTRATTPPAGVTGTGTWVAMDVIDNGGGMSADTLERIFDPFFTTKVERGGTGIGLAMVHRIVKKLGGVVHVQSEPGDGTKFTVYLPPSA